MNKICNFSGKRKVTDGPKLPSADNKMKYFTIYVGTREHLGNNDSSQFQLEDCGKASLASYIYVGEEIR